MSQIPITGEARADVPELDEIRDDGASEVTADLAYKRLAIVNAIFVGPQGAGDREWVLIDAGLFGTKRFIKSTAERRFGGNARPAAIILTHGHFDHVGVLEDLAAEWDVPVRARARKPYLNVTETYPPPDSTVGGE